MNLFGKLQHRMARAAVRKRFSVMRCAGLHLLENLPENKPVILCPIHTSWWDGFFASWLFTRMPRRVFRLAQEDQHLRRYPWFRHAGVLGVDWSGPGKLRASLAGLASALQDPRVVMVYFPQGILTVQGAGPIVVRRGIGWLAEKSGAAVLPVVWRHGFREGTRPELWVKLGPLLHGGGDNLASALQSHLQEMDLDLAEDWAAGKSEGYAPLWSPSLPINERWLAVKNRFGGKD